MKKVVLALAVCSLLLAQDTLYVSEVDHDIYISTAPFYIGDTVVVCPQTVVIIDSAWICK